MSADHVVTQRTSELRGGNKRVCVKVHHLARAHPSLASTSAPRGRRGSRGAAATSRLMRTAGRVWSQGRERLRSPGLVAVRTGCSFRCETLEMYETQLRPSFFFFFSSADDDDHDSSLDRVFRPDCVSFCSFFLIPVNLLTIGGGKALNAALATLTSGRFRRLWPPCCALFARAPSTTRCV